MMQEESQRRHCKVDLCPYLGKENGSVDFEENNKLWLVEVGADRLYADQRIELYRKTYQAWDGKILEPSYSLKLGSYSAVERKDLRALINDTRNRYNDMTLLGLHGESLGAATSVAVLQYKPDVDFVVADCGFSNIKEVLMGKAHLQGWMVDVVSLFAKLRYGYSYGQMRPIDCLAENQVPICFIHGSQDSFIPPRHSEEMKAATKGYSELHIIEGADHAQSVLVNPSEYKKIVELFIGRIEPGML